MRCYFINRAQVQNLPFQAGACGTCCVGYQLEYCRLVYCSQEKYSPKTLIFIAEYARFL